MSEHPIYDSTVAALEWSPTQLREPFDLQAVLAHSYAVAYQRVYVHQRLRQLIDQRRRQRARVRRLTPLP